MRLATPAKGSGSRDFEGSCCQISRTAFCSAVVVPSLHRIRNRGPRSWAVSFIRKRAEYLGAVVAPKREAAEAASVEPFSLDSWQRKRLVLTEIR
jgi:hypothetical protein